MAALNQSMTSSMAYNLSTSEHTLILKIEKKEFLGGKIYIFRKKSDFSRFCEILAKNAMIVEESMRSLRMNHAKQIFSFFFPNRLLSCGK